MCSGSDSVVMIVACTSSAHHRPESERQYTRDGWRGNRWHPERDTFAELGGGLVTTGPGWIGLNRLVQELAREVLNLDHPGYQKKVDQRSNHEQAACKEPDQASDPSAQVKPVQSQNPKASHKPKKIADKGVFHSNTLGS